MGSVLVAIDVGNSRAKWGLFRDGELEASASHAIGALDGARAILSNWKLPAHDIEIVIGSVNPQGTSAIKTVLEEFIGADVGVHMIERAEQVPIATDVDQPEQVGVDRLLNALAVAVRKPPKRPALAVDCGSAVTVDLITAEGVFAGGAILAGMGLAARALANFTARLPEVEVRQIPDPVGKNTNDAIRAGLYWGTVGAINELVRRTSEAIAEAPVVYITGGEAALLAAQLERPAVLIADLTLHGLKQAYEMTQRTG